ncbi:sensor histidine kinase [Xanthobacteraceae bacterium A53D]
MRQVFSRWPSGASAAAGPAGEADGLPAWMMAARPPRWPLMVGDWLAAVLPVVLPALLAALAARELALGRGAGVLLGIGALGVAGLAVMRLRRQSRELRHSRREARAIFERSGISMWREDWTTAGAAVMALRKAGVTDLESHYADRPEELRALKAQVIIRDVNDFTVEETGAPGKEAYLGPLDRLLPETDQTFVQWLVAFGRGDRFFRSEAHVKTAEGIEIDTLFTAMLPGDLDGFSDIVVTSVDITGYKRAHARLSAAETDAAKSSRITTANALSASIAHEVNSPLAAILANGQAAQRLIRRDTPDIEEVSAALDDVVSQATRARDVVARITSCFSNAPGAFGAVDLVAVARSANLIVEAELRGLGAVVHLSAPDELPAVWADVVLVQQVFVNLLLNAAQAMAQGDGRRDITVSMRVEQSWLAVVVSDSGPGVEIDKRGQIFAPFHSNRPGGMGMGLAICRNCIDAHGGDIWVDVAPEGGAAFHFTLPRAPG